MNKVYLIILLFSFISCTSTSVIVDGELCGTVRDAESLQPLPNCIVTIDAINLTVRTNQDGSFTFPAIQMGEYSLSFKCIGYISGTKSVRVIAEQSNNIDIYMNQKDLPTVRTDSVSDITQHTAELHATIQQNGGSEILERGFRIGTSILEMDKISINEHGINQYAYLLDNLEPDCQYYYQAYVINQFGEGRGNMLSFKTLPEGSVNMGLSVITRKITSLSEKEATLQAELRFSDSDEEIEYGFEYGEEIEKMTDHILVGTGRIDTFSYKLTYLKKLKRYFYRAFAKSNISSTYGDILTFDVPDYAGREYVDLGLPSGLKWSTEAIGSEFFDMSGYIESYAWGASIDSFKDIAREKWGGSWRMPTKEEAEELINACVFTEIAGGSSLPENPDLVLLKESWIGPNGNKITFKSGTIIHNGVPIDEEPYDPYEELANSPICFWTSQADTHKTSGEEKAYMMEIRKNNPKCVLYPISTRAYIRPVSQ